jgi:ABC-type nickel/cobalt efflux system permease component RcnA
MNRITLISAVVACLALLLVLLLPLLYLSEQINSQQLHQWLLIATIGWFIAVPFWFRTPKAKI